MGHTSRLPVVRRLEYLMDFLAGLKEESGQTESEKKLAERKLRFEVEKYKALGRGRPFMKKLKVARDLFTNCFTMSQQMGLARNRGRPMLTELGHQFLSLKGDDQVERFAQLFINTYSLASGFLLALSVAPRQEVKLPDTHIDNGKKFREAAKRHRLDINAVNFLVVRDILSQVSLINWHPFIAEQERWWDIYLTCILNEASGFEGQGLLLRRGFDEYYIVHREVALDAFVEVVFTEYMNKTRDIQYKPVFYSDLRSSVCYRLRISDSIFDRQVKKLLDGHPGFTLIWSSGTMPYEKDSASLLKSLPPKTPNEQYIIYLKMGKL